MESGDGIKLPSGINGFPIDVIVVFTKGTIEQQFFFGHRRNIRSATISPKSLNSNMSEDRYEN